MKRFLSKSIFALSLILAPVAACTTDETDLTEQAAEAVSPPSFDVWQSERGEFYFHLTAANGEVLLNSEGYDSRLGALNGLLAVLDNGGLATRYVITKGVDGKYYVKLTAGNNRTIATAEGYASKSNATRAVKTLVRNVAAYLEQWDAGAGARYQVKYTDGGNYSFGLYAANGEQVLRSETYRDEAAALNGAFAVDEAGRDLGNFEIRTASNGQAYFVLKAANSQIVGTSELYATASNAKRAIEAVNALIQSGNARLL